MNVNMLVAWMKMTGNCMRHISFLTEQILFFYFPGRGSEICILMKYLSYCRR